MGKIGMMIINKLKKEKMKTKLLAILAVSALAFTACSDDDDPTPGNNGDGPLTELNGNITEDVTLAATSVKMTGPTYVKEGVTITIPAGTTITADAKGTGVYLLVERGAKIIAEGTADKPIVFTSASAKSGSWGGLIINGYAPISSPDGGNFEWHTEIAQDYKYGGDKINDNSGVLKFVKIEYSGAKIDGDAEHNGLTLNGVGNGTQISDIYIKDGADDGIEFFGGSVNVTNLLVVNSEDDMFDFTQGYTGTLTNAYGIWSNGYVSTSDDPRGIEADGNLDGETPNDKGQSNFTVKDMTIVNKSQADMNDMIKIRRGATATITNLLLEIAEGAKFDETDIIDLTDGKTNGTDASSITYTFNPESLFNATKVKGLGATITKTDSQTGANTSVFSWTGYSF